MQATYRQTHPLKGFSIGLAAVLLVATMWQGAQRFIATTPTQAWMVTINGKQYHVRLTGHDATETPAVSDDQPVQGTVDIAMFGDTERAVWALDLLGLLDNPAPSPETVAYVVAWTEAEDRGRDAIDRHNLLNTTQESDSVTMVINGDGVKGYSTRADGLAMTVKTLHCPCGGQGYVEIVEGLRTNDPERALKGLYASPWGTDADSVSSIYHNEVLPRVTSSMTIVSSQTTPHCPVTPCWQSGSGYSAGHPGIDLGATMGQAVYAPIDGVVHTSITWPCGNGLSITHGDTMVLMCHLSAFFVEDGVDVRAGDQVADAGSTGQSTGPHVHFEIRHNGVNNDPSFVLRQ